jgi:5,10-methylenetetrahydrofolate reductase
LALQADLLAAYALGISNVMAVEGVEPSMGDHHRAHPVHDLDLLELIEAMGNLQSGRDLAGSELHGAPSYCVGSTITTGRSEALWDNEFEGLKRKMEAGATFFITQPVFHLPSLSGFLRRAEEHKAVIIPTILLLKSVGMARYIEQHLEQVHIPGELITRIQKAPDKAGECTRIARELVYTLRDTGCRGVLISTIGWEDRLPDILDG